MNPPHAAPWHELQTLGVVEMDQAHAEFVEIVTRLQQADARNRREALEAFLEHARRHFTAEDQAMTESAYENARCHMEEHQAVIASVREVLALDAARFEATAIRLAEELIRWFPGHTRVMDEGLAGHLRRQRLGGSPIRIERSPRSGQANGPL